MSTGEPLDLRALVMGDDRADLSQAADPLVQRAAREAAAAGGAGGGSEAGVGAAEAGAAGAGAAGAAGAADGADSADAGGASAVDARDLTADLNAAREYAAAREASAQRAAAGGAGGTSGASGVDAQGRPTHSSTGVPLDYAARVPVRPATSVIMLREGTRSALEVFVQHRVKTMDFAAGVVVFPGGRVDPQDADAGRALQLTPDAEAAHTRAWTRTDALTVGGIRTLLACAVREVEEETGQTIIPAALNPWANLVTPPGRSKRFDTYFYVTGGDELDALNHQTTEADNSEWLRVDALLSGEKKGDFRLMRPTLALLTELEAMHDLGSVLGLATSGERQITSIRPEIPGVH